VGGANVFQKEKEKEKEEEMETEEETRECPNKWRTTRDSPEQGAKLVSAGVRGECGSKPYHTEYLD
jgi:hypothetical protein